MRLSALEIKKKEFQQKMRGADPEEVQAFLDLVSAEVESLAIEKKELETSLATTRERLEHFLSLEQMIEKTLVASQQTAVKIEDQARREAELILRDAALERDRKLADVRAELERGEREVFRLHTEYDMTLARMRAISSSFAGFLNTLETERNPPQIAVSAPIVTELAVAAPVAIDQIAAAPVTATLVPNPVLVEEPIAAPPVAAPPVAAPPVAAPPVAAPPVAAPPVAAPPVAAPPVAAPPVAAPPVVAPALTQPWMPTPLPQSEQMTWGN